MARCCANRAVRYTPVLPKPSKANSLKSLKSSLNCSLVTSLKQV